MHVSNITVQVEGGLPAKRVAFRAGWRPAGDEAICCVD
jgi:hypothetical protein